jgi:lipid-binding SYLF domain-containing protein
MKYTIALLTLSLSTFAFAGSGEQDTTARLQAAGTVMNQIMAAPDKGIPEEVLNGAKCIAVVPSMGKGGFIVGGEHGRGVRRHSFRSVAAILASRLAPSQSILSCCS